VSRRAAPAVAWSLWAACVLTIGILVVSGSSASGLSSDIGGATFILAFATTGALVASRRPAHPIGWLMCASALAFAIGGVAVEYGDYALTKRQGTVPAESLAAWVGTFVWTLGIGPAATFLLLLFPTGRLPSKRWRPVAWVAGAGLAMITMSIALTPGVIEDARVSNPVGLSGGEDVLSLLGAAGGVALVVTVLLSAASLIARFRNAPAEERQQLKWIAGAAPLVGLGTLASLVIESTSSSDAAGNASNTIVSVSLAVVPVAIGIAILRHRLFDIDVVINRTLVYGGLTATLAAAYLGTVVLLQVALSPLTEQSDLAIAGSTLAVAALFRPARRRIQELVDRRFFRRKYDAALTLELFGSRLRNEVALDSLSAELRSVVLETMQPAHVSVWLRAPETQP
jgi:hypothetical protein